MIPLLRARIPEGAARAVAEVLDSGFVGGGAVAAGAGSPVKRFEEALARFLEVDDPARVVTTNSGTSALFLALRLASVGRADPRDPHRPVVVTTPMTFIATTTAIYQAGGRPRWADVARGSCQVDVERALDLARSDTSVGALMVVAWAGYTPDRLELLDTAPVPVVIDAAQAIGACYAGRPLHAHADFTCYSFAPTKHLTTGDGGALVCRSAREAERARRLAWFGMRRELRPPERFASDQDVGEFGYKLHMNNVTAALGLAGLGGAREAIDRACLNANRYRTAFANRVCVEPLAPRGEPSSYTFTIFVDDPARFTAHMAERGVQVAQPHRRNDANSFVRVAGDSAPEGALPNTGWAQAHYVSLPVGWWLTDADVDRVVDAVLGYPSLGDVVAPFGAL